MIGASIFMPELKRGTITNEFGFYSLELSAKMVKVNFPLWAIPLSIGRQVERKKI